MPVRSPKRGLPSHENLPAHLKEFTIAVGEADLYVNLDRSLELEEGYLLYEAILSDADGSRRIYVDREELAECLENSPILHPAPPKDPAEGDSPE